MKCCSLLLLTVLASTVNEAFSNKCNPEVIDGVKNIWRKRGTPLNLEKQLIEARVSYVVATTSGVFFDEDNIKCLQAVTTECGYLMNIFFNNGTEIVTKTYTIEDLNGDLYTPGDEQHRYHLTTIPNSNIQAFYTCVEDDEDLGENRGLIRVLGKPNAITRAAIKMAIKDFATLGIEVSKFFPDHCED